PRVFHHARQHGLLLRIPGVRAAIDGALSGRIWNAKARLCDDRRPLLRNTLRTALRSRLANRRRRPATRSMAERRACSLKRQREEPEDSMEAQARQQAKGNALVIPAADCR